MSKVIWALQWCFYTEGVQSSASTLKVATLPQGFQENWKQWCVTNSPLCKWKQPESTCSPCQHSKKWETHSLADFSNIRIMYMRMFWKWGKMSRQMLRKHVTVYRRSIEYSCACIFSIQKYSGHFNRAEYFILCCCFRSEWSFIGALKLMSQVLAT